MGLGAGVVSAGVFTGPMLACWLNEMVGYKPQEVASLGVSELYNAAAADDACLPHAIHRQGLTEAWFFTRRRVVSGLGSTPSAQRQWTRTEHFIYILSLQEGNTDGQWVVSKCKQIGYRYICG